MCVRGRGRGWYQLMNQWMWHHYYYYDHFGYLDRTSYKQQASKRTDTTSLWSETKNLSIYNSLIHFDEREITHSIRIQSESSSWNAPNATDLRLHPVASSASSQRLKPFLLRSDFLLNEIWPFLPQIAKHFVHGLSSTWTDQSTPSCCHPSRLIFQRSNSTTRTTASMCPFKVQYMLAKFCK